MNKDGFLKDLMNLNRLTDYNDVDGSDLYDFYIKHGFAVQRPATAEEATTKDAIEWGVNEGDSWTVWSDEALAFLKP